MANDPRWIMTHDDSKGEFITYLETILPDNCDVPCLVSRMIDCIHDMHFHMDKYTDILYKYNKKTIDSEMDDNPVSKLLYDDKAVTFMSRAKDEYPDLETKDIIYVIFFAVNKARRDCAGIDDDDERDCEGPGY